jgi:hypothetical protein
VDEMGDNENVELLNDFEGGSSGQFPGIILAFT